MENKRVQSPSLPNHRSQSALSEEGLPTPNHRDSIEDKIQQMTKSLTEAVIFSSSRPMDALKKLQSESQSLEKETNNCQTVFFQELNEIELSLMSLDRESMLHQAGSKIAREQIQGRLDDCRVELKRSEDSVHEKLSQYRDAVADVKVKMIQTESQSKEKALKLERDTKAKLISIEKSLMFNQSPVDGIRNKFKRQFKELQAKIQTENRELEKQSIKRQILVSQLSSSLNGRVEAEKIRQKDGFQQHYRTLEEIFRLLEEDIDMKQ